MCEMCVGFIFAVAFCYRYRNC